MLIYKLRKVIMSQAKELRTRKSTMLNLRKVMLQRSPRRISCVGYVPRSTPSSSAHIRPNFAGANDTNLKHVGPNFQRKLLDTYLLLGSPHQLLRRTQRRGRAGDPNLLVLTGVLILRLQEVRQSLPAAGEGEPDAKAIGSK